MKKFIFLVMAFCAVSIYAQKMPETLKSLKLNADRTFDVYLPSSYEENLENKYPVLYLLDGEYLADPFNGILKYGNYWDDLPEMIVVAIHQNYGEARYNDSETGEDGFPAKSGAKFFEFIGIELIPYIEKKYRTLNFRMIAGHDTTAGFLTSYLYKENPIFNAYIAISPELSETVTETLGERLKVVAKPLFFYHASSNADLEEIQTNTKKVDDVLKDFKNETLKYRYDVFKNTAHYSLVAEAIPSALYFIFNGYQPISKLEFQEKILKLDSGYAQYLIDKYDYIEKQIGLKVKPRYSDFKAIEAAILKNKAYTDLELLGDYADKQYPKTMLGTYHRGLFFEKTGNFKRAVKEYQNAYTLKEIGDLTKNYLLDRAEGLKTKKDAPIETAPVEETPKEDKPTEEKKD